MNDSTIEKAPAESSIDNPTNPPVDAPANAPVDNPDARADAPLAEGGEKARVQKKNRVNEKKKPGNPGDFHGQRLAFLESKYGTYRLASAMGPKAVREWYRDGLFPEWWERFHWSLPLDREPSPNDEYPSDRGMTKKQMDEKACKMNATMNKVKTWFNNRRNAANLTSQRSVWTPWLNQLRTVLDGPPRRAHNYQFYMKHENFKDKVGTAFDEAWAKETDQSAARIMTVRCKVAKELLRKEPTEIQAALDDEAEAEYQAAKQQYDLGLSAGSYRSAEDRDAAIETLAAVVQPLLDGIRSHTGMFVGLTAVSPSMESSEAPRCTFLSAGRSAEGKDFSGDDPTGFRLFSRLFIRWSSVASGALPPSVLQGSTVTQDSGALPSSSSSLRPQSTPSTPSSRLLTPSHPLASTHSHLNTNLKRAIDEIAAKIRQYAICGTSPNDELLLSIARMIPAEKEKRIKELCRMADYEFQRANNIALHNSTLAKLGFKPADRADLIDEDEEPEDERAYVPGGGTSPISTPTRRSTRSTTLQAATSSKGPVSSTSSISNDGAVAAPPPQPRQPLLPPSTNEAAEEPPTSDETVDNGNIHTDMDVDPLPTPSNSTSTEATIQPKPITPSVRKVVVPTWFSSAFVTFDSVDKSVYGGEWFVAVRAWEDIESHFRYEPNGPLLTKSQRPSQVGLWVKSARYKNVYEKIPDLDIKVFSKQWWKWWLAVNPSWRGRVGQDRLSKEGSGSFKAMTVSGVNGLLSVLVSLWWWREKTPDSSPCLSSWKEAVADIAYVFAAARNEVLSAETDGDLTDPRPSKRKRAT